MSSDLPESKLELTENHSQHNAPWRSKRLQYIADTLSTLSLSEPNKDSCEIAERISHAFNAHACIIRMLSEAELQLLGHYGVDLDRLLFSIPADVGIGREMIQKCIPILLNNPASQPAILSNVNTLIPADYFTAYAGAPLRFKEEIMGLIGIYHRDAAKTFTEEDLTDLQMVANHLAVMLVNYKLNQQLIEKNRQLDSEIRIRIQAEKQFQLVEKMESIGRLAGGMAHDFNNLLTAISGYAEMAYDEIKDDSVAQQYLRSLQQTVDKASNLTSSLMAFARKQPGINTSIDLNTCIEEITHLFAPLTSSEITISFNLHTSECIVEADAARIDQILMNMLVNARDAMPQGGVITLETSICSFTNAEAKQIGLHHAGRYVLLKVSDTGEGMTDEVMEHIFEPFFTTRPQGRGTGLGLASCYGIVQQYNGIIHVQSAPQKGTVFSIYLPYSSQRNVEPPKTKHSSQTPLILLVEDDPHVREIVSKTLRTGDTRLIAAENGLIALELARQSAAKIDLLITDIRMPQMNGIELAERLIAVDKITRVLFISGYADGEKPTLSTAHHAEFLAKPFTPKALRAIVQKILSQNQTTT